MSDVSALGWQGEFKYSSPEVKALRDQLAAEAGIRGVEVVDPAEEGYAQKAAKIFLRDGFVLVKVSHHTSNHPPLLSALARLAGAARAALRLCCLFIARSSLTGFFLATQNRTASRPRSWKRSAPAPPIPSPRWSRTIRCESGTAAPTATGAIGLTFCHHF